MKKKVILIALISVILTLIFALGVFASSKITLIVNGIKANDDPVSIDGVTYVPLRAAAELLGVDVIWDGTTRTVTLNSSVVLDDTDADIAKKETTEKKSNEDPNVVYNSCADVNAAGKAPLLKGEPGYSKKLDRDGDGIACE